MTEAATMDDATIVALRRPFPKESVGKLPKPYRKDATKGQCNECGGYHGLPAAHLDYVGHAAVTDRLLTVDPFWSWEPFALDQNGTPAIIGGNLWIRLTVRGVTRIGVGDGASVKEMIGDAIRNAAMRFGVALDLWAKENLVEFAQALHATASAHAEGTPRAALDQALQKEQHVDVEPEARPKLTKAQNTKIQTLASELGLSREAKLSGLSQVCGREVTTTNDLTPDEASLAIERLSAKVNTIPKAADE